MPVERQSRQLIVWTQLPLQDVNKDEMDEGDLMKTKRFILFVPSIPVHCFMTFKKQKLFNGRSI